jgi:colanic acid/amylovoran biosynthesis glycosyltransferase
MAMELPVVSTRIMGLPELIDDAVNGLLVAPGRVEELTDALERLVRSPEERRRLGHAARERIRDGYDVARSAADMREVLASELGRAV